MVHSVYENTACNTVSKERTMIRTILWIIFMAVTLLIMAPVGIYYRLTLKHEPGDPIDPGIEKIVQVWAGYILAIIGIRVKAEGHEHIPPEAALFVGNHQGNFDIPIILCKLGPLKSIVAKAEVSKIPGLRMWMDHFDCILMDRDDPRQSLAALNRAQELLEQGRSVIIFPEGTRSKGPDMAEFKAGALRCALKAGVPVVPFALEGSWRAMEANNGIMRPADVQLRILPTFDTAGLSKAQTRTVSQEVQQLIQDALDDMRDTPEQERISWTTQPDS